MRYATALADSLTVHHDPGGSHIMGYLKRGARVVVVGGPVDRERRWWRVQDGSLGGWVAEGDGKVKWLAVDPVPAPPPDCEPPELPDIPAMNWVPPAVIAAVIAAVVLISWLLS